MPDFLLEVGTEELPADFVASAIAQLQQKIPMALADHVLTGAGVQVYGTPRRLAVLLENLPAQQPDRQEEIKGPPAQAAYKDGEPTPAALGFAKKQGVSVEDFELRDTDKGQFVFVQKCTPGRPTPEILQEIALDWFLGLEGKRFMRWGDGDLRFPRPIRWLVCLWDDQVLPLTLVNGATSLQSDRLSRGHRVLHPEAIAIPQAKDYAATLGQASIEVDPQQRQGKIRAEIERAAQQVQGEPDIPEDLLAEVVHLVEAPRAVVGDFEGEFLHLPAAVIKMVMVTHQRYFPLSNADGALLPHFVTISNGDPQKDTLVAAGNGRVIRARLADAQFFYAADCEKPLEHFLPALEKVTFQEELGSIAAKVDRLTTLSLAIADQLQCSGEDRQAIARAARLCKADLVSQMVYEFPELQGIMGENYAQVGGETPAVAKAIFEHYLPRSAEDALPETLAGQVVGLGDRLDTLVSIFGLGLLPSGSSDPFALRRAANAILNIVWANHLTINLGSLLRGACDRFVADHPQRPSPWEHLRDFFQQRFQTLLQEAGYDYDLVQAVIAPEEMERVLTDGVDARDRVALLQTLRGDGRLAQIYETINRATRLASKGTLDRQRLDPQGIIQPAAFEKASEQAFYEALIALLPQTQIAQSNRHYETLINGLGAIAPVVSRFFDGEDSVLVMADDATVRANRLNLLGLLRNHALVLADFGPILKP